MAARRDTFDAAPHPSPPSSHPSQPAVRPDREALAASVRLFLVAAGLDPDTALLRETPTRVADAWMRDFLDGYAQSPASVLGARHPVSRVARSPELVVVTGLRFHSVCPHHLLPWEGVAHLAYVPNKSVVGFGRLSAVLDCLGHRLVLQEVLAQQVAEVLYRDIPSRGAACILEGHQGCLTLRGAKQRDAETHAEAYTGVLAERPQLRRELWQRIGTGRAAETVGPRRAAGKARSSRSARPRKKRT